MVDKGVECFIIPEGFPIPFVYLESSYYVTKHLYQLMNIELFSYFVRQKMWNNSFKCLK